ncbi:HAD family hydrolase (plasmid) [Xanthomonas phaseoli pv. phaseoli]|nr:HAD family hydrolase [Xanthomonas phaseoli pv. phaseoli]
MEKSRNANSRVILISNRGHGDLENEINHLGMMHYFDVVSGAEEVTLEKSHFPLLKCLKICRSDLSIH